MTFTAAFTWFKPQAAQLQPAFNVYDPYKVLGVSRMNDESTIKKAYRKLMMKHHPDLGGDINITYRINAAYNEIKKKRGF